MVEGWLEGLVLGVEVGELGGGWLYVVGWGVEVGGGVFVVGEGDMGWGWVRVDELKGVVVGDVVEEEVVSV